MPQNPADFDPSYSPNERAEMAHNEPNCSHCADSGYLQDDNGQALFCECPEGNPVTRLDDLFRRRSALDEAWLSRVRASLLIPFEADPMDGEGDPYYANF